MAKSYYDMTEAERTEWLEMMFEFEYCSECHGDVEDHACVAGPFDLPFAACLKPHDEVCKIDECDWFDSNAIGSIDVNAIRNKFNFDFLRRLPMSSTSAYVNRVNYNLSGLEAVSTGVCPGCDQCASEFGYDDDDDDCEFECVDYEEYECLVHEVKMVGYHSEPNHCSSYRTAIQKFNDDYEAGEIYDEGSFSKSACGICNNHLHGTRFSWHGIDRETKKLYHFDDACSDCVMYLANGVLPDSADYGE